MNGCQACDSMEFRYLEKFGTGYAGECRHCGLVNHFTAEEIDGEEPDEDDEDEGPDCDDSDDGYALASIGWGTDEDYGYFGGDE